MKTFKIWDNVEKTYVTYPGSTPINFASEDEAEQFKDEMLSSGQYPDRPHTVYSIIEIKQP